MPANILLIRTDSAPFPIGQDQDLSSKPAISTDASGPTLIKSGARRVIPYAGGSPRHL